MQSNICVVVMVETQLGDIDGIRIEVEIILNRVSYEMTVEQICTAGQPRMSGVRQEFGPPEYRM